MVTPGQPKPNYQRRLDQLLAQLAQQGRTPSLLLHVCCAPCATVTLEVLAAHFALTLYYYNPNIYPRAEYDARLAALHSLLAQTRPRNPIRLQIGSYEPERFEALAAGHEADPEGGERCRLCYHMRLQAAAELARAGGYEYFGTTLSVGPRKDAQALADIGQIIATETGTAYLAADFKKKGGYQRSVALSRQYGLYRQRYCGCRFSLRGDDPDR